MSCRERRMLAASRLRCHVSSACGVASSSSPGPEVRPSHHAGAEHSHARSHLGAYGEFVLPQVILSRCNRSRRVTVQCFQQQAAPVVAGRGRLGGLLLMDAFELCVCCWNPAPAKKHGCMLKPSHHGSNSRASVVFHSTDRWWL